VPSLPSTERTAESLRRIADEFDRAGEAASRAGIRFGYHNHDWEVRPLVDGTVPIDLLLERTDRAVVDWQMDVYWTVHGGAEPERWLRGGRVTSVHVKDRAADGAMVDVGRGEIDWASILNLAESYGLRHAYVEHDRPDDALESARRSIAHLKLLRGMAE
jgi:sugar phosphate isomerase/epimerase